MTREELENKKDLIVADAIISLIGKKCCNCVFGSESSKKCWYKFNGAAPTYSDVQINQCTYWEFEGYNGS